MPAENPHGEANKHSLGDQALLYTAMQIVRDNQLGIFTTVNAKGEPMSRWMVAALSDNGVCQLFSLTGRESRKLHDIGGNPSVCWVFSSPDHNDVVTITGKAVVLPTLSALHGTEVAWVPLMQATRAYTLTAPSDPDDAAFSAVETNVEHIELISPRLGIYAPCVVPFDTPVPAGQAGSGLDI